MNILFITCWFPLPHKPNFGIFIKEHAKAVQKAGAQVQIAHVWAVNSNNLLKIDIEREQDESGVVINSLVVYSMLYKFFRYFPILLYLPLLFLYKNKIRPNFKPDCLHGNVIYPAGFLTYYLAKAKHIPYSITEHWSKVESIFSKRFFARKAKKVYNNAIAVHPVSEYLAHKVRKHISDPNKVQVVPNVVDDVFHYDSDVKGNDDKLELLCIMNQRKKRSDKKPVVILKAIERLPYKDQQQIRVRYLGPNQENGVVQQALKKIDIKAEIILDGLRPKSYLAFQMNRADYLVHPTEFETFGVVVAEALKSGLPCIVSRVEALEEKISSDNGILIELNTPTAWKDVIKDLLDGKYEFNRRQIAENTGNKYSYKTIGNSYISFYRKAVG